ncbi:MAG: hypothetical protein HYU87_05375 [Chloroflexi bacterium]|nr:hypothetical protein [Chloroflexota bacterium]
MRQMVMQFLDHVKLSCVGGHGWRGFRFLLGPWRWMLIVYVFIEDDDRVVVVTMAARCT